MCTSPKIVKTHPFFRFHDPADSGVMQNINFLPTFMLLLTHYYLHLHFASAFPNMRICCDAWQMLNRSRNSRLDNLARLLLTVLFLCWPVETRDCYARLFTMIQQDSLRHSMQIWIDSANDYLLGNSAIEWAMRFTNLHNNITHLTCPIGHTGNAADKGVTWCCKQVIERRLGLWIKTVYFFVDLLHSIFPLMQSQPLQPPWPLVRLVTQAVLVVFYRDSLPTTLT